MYSLLVAVVALRAREVSADPPACDPISSVCRRVERSHDIRRVEVHHEIREARTAGIEIQELDIIEGAGDIGRGFDLREGFSRG